jgi:cell division protein FtsA
MMAGTRFDTVYVGIGGGQIDGLTTEVSMELATKEVTPRDMQQVIEMARAQRRRISTRPCTSCLSNIVWMRRPDSPIRLENGYEARCVGAGDHRLEARARDAQKGAGSGKLGVQAIVAQPLASARAVLTPDERDMGSPSSTSVAVRLRLPYTVRET